MKTMYFAALLTLHGFDVLFLPGLRWTGLPRVCRSGKDNTFRR